MYYLEDDLFATEEEMIKMYGKDVVEELNKENIFPEEFDDDTGYVYGLTIDLDDYFSNPDKYKNTVCVSIADVHVYVPENVAKELIYKHYDEMEEEYNYRHDIIEEPWYEEHKLTLWDVI